MLPCCLNPHAALDEGDIAVMKTYGIGAYTKSIKAVEVDINKRLKGINELTGIKESETGLAHPGLWDLAADKQMMGEEQPLQVARCTKIINKGDTDENGKFVNHYSQCR